MNITYLLFVICQLSFVICHLLFSLSASHCTQCEARALEDDNELTNDKWQMANGK